MRPLLLLLALATVSASAQTGPPAWTAPPAGAYPERMSITGVAQLSGVELRSRNDRVAAFRDGVIRGVAAPTLVGNRRMFFLSVAGTDTDGELTFQAYDATADRVVDLQPNIDFDAASPLGSVATPVVWTLLAGGGQPGWVVNASAFPATMTLVGRVVQYNAEPVEAGAVVGAFLGNEVRGVAPLTASGAFGLLSFLTVYGADAESGALSFRVYLPSADRSFTVDATAAFAARSSAGSVSNPILLPIRSGATLPGPQGWWMLAPPGADATVATTLSPVWTQGFPGAGDSGGASNVYRYSEPDGTYVSVGSAGEAWPRGEGRFVYVYADDNPYTPVIDGGFPKVLAPVGIGPTSAFPFGVSFTANNGEPEGDGWNLLGNPFDDLLDWDNGWTRTNLSNSVYVWDPTYLGGSYRVWNGTVGSLANGVLMRGSAFWVQTMSTGAVLQAPPSARILADAARGVDNGATPVVPLRLESVGRPGLAAEAWVTFQEGAVDGLDMFDAWALAPHVSDYVSLGSTAIADAGLLAVDARGPDPVGIVSIPLSVGAIAAGEAAADSLLLSWPGIAVPDAWSLTLVDAESGERIDMREQTERRFSLSAGAGRSAVPDGASLLGGAVVRRVEQSSARFRLEIGPRSVGTEPDATIGLTLDAPFPNPSRGAVTWSFTLGDAADVRFDLYDVLGRHVAELASGPRAAGRHTVSLDSAHLPPGTYSARLDAGGTTRVGRVVILR